MANSSIGTAYVNIVPKADGIKNQLGSVMDNAASSAGTSAGGLAGMKLKAALGAAAIGAGVAIIAGLKKSIGEGAKLEQSIGGIETLFKGSSDAVIKNARQAYKTAGISANEYMENVTSFSAGLIKSLGGDTKKAAQIADTAIVDMSDNANKMGTDIGSIQNAYQGFAKQNYTMLDNLKLGYGGTKQEMERLLEDASKLSGQKYDISNLSDVYQAIHVIQGELGITGTTAQEASQTLAGSFNSMKSAFTDFMGNLAMGENVGPSMQALVESIVTFIGGNLIPAIGRVFASLPEAIGALMSSGAPQMMEKAAIAIDAAAPTLAEKGADLVIKLGAGIIKALPSIISVAGRLVNAILKVIVGLPATLLARGMAAAGNFGLGLLKGFNSAIGKAKAAVSKFLDPVKNVVNKIKGFFPLSIGKIFSNFKLPHLSVSGGKAPYGIAGMGSLPKFSVSWYKTGGIFNKPTVFSGIGIGEAGPEAVLPLDTLWKKLDMIAAASSGNNVINVYGTPGMSVDDLAAAVEQRLVRQQKQRMKVWGY